MARCHRVVLASKKGNQASLKDYINTTVGCVTALLSYKQPSEAVIPPSLENFTLARTGVFSAGKHHRPSFVPVMRCGSLLRVQRGGLE
jgi:hypothetical protein